ncbi:MAG: hypothetical protein ACPGJV_05615 [Bacteriovoracaceae bacterium]
MPLIPFNLLNAGGLNEISISANSFALNLQTDILDNQDNLIFKDSRGPGYKKQIEKHLSGKLTGEDPFYKSIVDGLNHDAYEDPNCKPKNVTEVYDIDLDWEWPSPNSHIPQLKRKEVLAQLPTL